MSSRFFRRTLLMSALIALPAFACSPLFIMAQPAFSASISANAVEAAKEALRGDYNSAKQFAARSEDPAAIKLVELLYLKDHWKDAGYPRVMRFLGQANKWPLSETLRKNAEVLLWTHNEEPVVVLEHFGESKPATVEGQLALARATLKIGNKAEAAKLLRQAWLSPEIDTAGEKNVMSEFGKLLTEDDHRKRMWSLVLAQESNAAIRNSKRLGAKHEEAAKVAQLLLRSVTGAEKAHASLPADMRNQAAMKYALARFYRIEEKFSKARSVLATISGKPSEMVNAEAIWTERRIIARRSIGPKQQEHWATAYRIASNHGLTSGTEAADAHFLSGWIALRFLKDAPTAIKHFQAQQQVAQSRTEKARAQYWIGRSHLLLGDNASAKAAFHKAAEFQTVYYGQMAREHIGLGDVPEKIASGKPSADAIARVENDEVMRAFRIMDRAGRKDQLYLFTWALANRFATTDELNAVAQMVNEVGGTTMSLKFAKAAGQRGLDIDAWSYPVRALPDWKQIGKPVEKSLVYSLSRQESEFNTNAGSKAGAQGLMQLMPGTARLIARQYGLAYAPDKLKSDPAYNVKLGAAHLADLVDEYSGSYVLTLVAYNAGPRRVDEWTAYYGDPRKGEIDPIDWVEAIPFHETRQYVQKVLQNNHIYRSRLAPDSVKAMSADLRRGGTSKVKVAATKANPDCGRADTATACE